MRKRAKVWKSTAWLVLCAALAACSSGNDGKETNGSPAPGNNSAKTEDGKTVVSMSVLTSDRFLMEAEQKFEQLHPDIDVQINELVPADTSGGGKIVMMQGAETGPKPEDVDKYASSVNAALMSGNASDIISAEYLPIDKYIEKGLLGDWDEWASKDGSFNKTDYYEKVMSGVSGGEGWYGVPTSFSLDVMLGDDSLLEQNSLNDATWTWDQFVDLLAKTKTDGKYGMSMIKPETLLKYVIESVYAQLVKKDGNNVSFDEQAFRAYMEKVKKLYDEGLATPEMMGPENTAFRLLSMDSPMNALLMPQMEGKSKAMLTPPASGTDEGLPFKSSQVLALNEKSDVKEAAWTFVSYLLSEEMQSSRAMMNFPVNKAALANGLASTKEMIEGGGNGEGGKKASIRLRGKDGEEMTPTISEEDMARVTALMPEVGKYANIDSKVLSMISEESAAYFTGGKSADAVAKSLSNRINTYLNE
ncbi:ABC transporter substrate-binding protein [Paenibacillus harenae]|uniref:Multiple sugar transport system substrate-binding protein n=1 Tax=Paenibacillus harenae TaxID=306543 RepID=A0ABT9TZ84_PAEHA|nr:ABC transporter substrate-binding protein [Paenibacillus harenae]MDQ0112623.1 multiple sugar transport system substrate-binding protein [Paenibacillus harenae]